MDEFRRLLLRGLGAGGALMAAIAANALKPTAVLAAEWNAVAFNARSTSAAMRGMGIVNPIESPDVILKAPDIAEDGGVVPIEVVSNVPGTNGLSVFVDGNPNPLAAHFDLAGGALPALALRIKMRQSSNVRGVAHAGGKAYFTIKEVKVTVGGCGG